jgi:hypothetical protein
MLQETDNRILQIYNIPDSGLPCKILGQGKYIGSLVAFTFGSIVLRWVQAGMTGNSERTF